MTGPQQSPPSSVPQDDDQQQQPQKQPQQQQQAEQPSPHKGCELALTYQPLTPVNLHELKRLNSVALPIPYPDSWYQQILVENSHPACTFLAYHRDRMVGGLVTRIDALQPAAHPMMTTMGVPYLPPPPPPPSSSSGLIRLYIMVICVHAPYRRSGVGSAMLQRLIDTAQQDPRVTDIQLHVHVGNRDALSFYKRHGFAVVHTVPNYYYKLSPPDGYLLSLPIQHQQQQQQQQQQQPSPPRPQTQPQSHPQYQPPFHAPPYAAPSPLFPQQPYGGFAQYGYGAPQYGGFVPYAQQQQPFMS